MIPHDQQVFFVLGLVGLSLANIAIVAACFAYSVVRRPDDRR